MDMDMDIRFRLNIVYGDPRWIYGLHSDSGKDDNIDNGSNMGVTKFYFQAWITLEWVCFG